MPGQRGKEAENFQFRPADVMSEQQDFRTEAFLAGKLPQLGKIVAQKRGDAAQCKLVLLRSWRAVSEMMLRATPSRERTNCKRQLPLTSLAGWITKSHR